MRKSFVKGLIVLSVSLMANLAVADFYVGAGAYASSFTVASADEDDQALSVLVGWEPPIIPFLSVEVAYHDLGSYSFPGADSIDVSAFSAQGVFAIPVVIFDIYAKLGYAKTDLDVGGNSNDSSDPYYAVGAAFTLLPIIDIYAEYQRFEFDDADIDAFGVGVKAHF